MFKVKKINFKITGIVIAILTLTLLLLPRQKNITSADYNPYGNLTGASSFSLTFNNQLCAGQIPSYTITAPSSWSGQPIYWTSTFNGSIVSQPTFALSSSGMWSEAGSSWQFSSVGSWTKTATINGVSQSLNFTVQNCGGVSGNQTIGGSVGTGFDPLIGGSVGGANSPTIGGSVGGANSSTIGENLNSSSLPNSYIDANGYVCQRQ